MKRQMQVARDVKTAGETFVSPAPAAAGGGVVVSEPFEKCVLGVNEITVRRDIAGATFVAPGQKRTPTTRCGG